jgi:hypothetical protein
MGLGLAGFGLRLEWAWEWESGQQITDVVKFVPSVDNQCPTKKMFGFSSIRQPHYACLTHGFTIKSQPIKFFQPIIVESSVFCYYCIIKNQQSTRRCPGKNDTHAP